MRVVDLGQMDFGDALALQGMLVAGIAAGNEPETLLLLEHPPVYTIGSGGNGANVLDPEVSAVRINRGGDVTWHGPGQLIGYPLVDLSRRGRDLHSYLRFLEELLILVAGDFGVRARRVPGKTGIWSGGGKLSSIGVGVRRWVSMHGFALNVSNDLTPFSLINPCGMVACPVNSLEQLTARPVPLVEVKSRVTARFGGLLEEWLPITCVMAGVMDACPSLEIPSQLPV